MKKIILFTFILSLTICNHLKSQENSMGFASGITFSRIYSSKFKLEMDYKAGYNLNVFYDFNVIRYLDLRVGLNNYTCGSKSSTFLMNEDGTVTGTDVEKWSFNYISLPLIVKPYIGTKVKAYLKIGLNFAYLMNNSYSSSARIPDFIEPKKFDLDQISGLGVEFPVYNNLCLGFESNYLFSYKVIANGFLKNSMLGLNFLLKYRFIK